MRRPRSPRAPILPHPPLPAPPAPPALLLSRPSLLWHPGAPYGPLHQGGGSWGRQRQAVAAAERAAARRWRHPPRPPSFPLPPCHPPSLPFPSSCRFPSAPSAMLAVCAAGGGSQRRWSCGLPPSPRGTIRARPAPLPPCPPPASLGRHPGDPLGPPHHASVLWGLRQRLVAAAVRMVARRWGHPAWFPRPPRPLANEGGTWRRMWCGRSAAGASGG